MAPTINRAAINHLCGLMTICGVPHHIHDGLATYIVHGLPTGDFLREFMNNNLQGALSRADDQNRYAFFQIGFFLWNHAPAQCWGRAGAWEEWVKRGGLEPLPAPEEQNEEQAS